jgi:hypothetical protein
MLVLSYQVQYNSFNQAFTGPDWCQIIKYSGLALLFPYSVTVDDRVLYATIMTVMLYAVSCQQCLVYSSRHRW